MSRRYDLVNQDKIRMKIGNPMTKRKTTHVTFDETTLKLVDRCVETGTGKFGSAFIEHAVRFFVCVLSGDPTNMDVSIEELSRFVITPAFSDNMREYAEKWDENRDNLKL